MKNFLNRFYYSKKSQRGFTLVELLITIVIFITLGGILLSSFFSTLRGTNKTNALINIRQQGDYALERIARSVRNAKSFIGVSNDGNTFTPSCSSGSYSYIKVENFDTTVPTTVFACTNNSLTENGKMLIDTQNTVKITNCQFTCTIPDPVSAPIVGIEFTISQISNNPLPENTASSTFKTKVGIRNYQ